MDWLMWHLYFISTHISEELIAFPPRKRLIDAYEQTPYNIEYVHVSHIQQCHLPINTKNLALDKVRILILIQALHNQVKYIFSSPTIFCTISAPLPSPSTDLTVGVYVAATTPRWYWPCTPDCLLLCIGRNTWSVSVVHVEGPIHEVNGLTPSVGTSVLEFPIKHRKKLLEN